jgi:prepilin-type N-terminal cleavage/methylation domain-containing protein
MSLRNVAGSCEGFTLVEVMVALTITLVVVMSLAAGSATMARMSGASAGLVRRSASMDEVATAVATMPWADLPSGTTCEDVSGDFPYERCVSVSNVSSKRKQITVVITPEDPRTPPDTITMERGRVATTKPFGS